jgi:hypothetical protein
MGVHAAALSPMHTCVRFARADDAAVAIARACVGTSAGICSQRTRHVRIYMFIYISTQRPVMYMGTRVCSCVRVRSRAGADDARVRGMCASVARTLRKAIHRWNNHIHCMCT